MQFFRLKQDTAYIDAPVISDVIKKIDRRYTIPAAANKIEKITLFQLSGKETPNFLDLLSRQIFLVSQDLRDTIKLYQPNLLFKMVILVHRIQKQQKSYYLPIFEPVNCLSENSIMTPNKSIVKSIVLRKSIIENETIFRVSHNYETIIVVRLDVAESILRRDFCGIKLERVQLE
jgi:hypothetical protein